MISIIISQAIQYVLVHVQVSILASVETRPRSHFCRVWLWRNYCHCIGSGVEGIQGDNKTSIPSLCKVDRGVQVNPYLVASTGKPLIDCMW